MRRLLMVFWMLLGSATSVMAQVSVGIGIGFPGVNIGINLPFYPNLVPVPGYPVYYAPGLSSNFFFYDGMYWVYQYDNWYSSSWYNGPWGMVYPYYVPQFVLRIPVRYYRSPPSYFYGWRADAPPRWGDHWGNAWQQQRRGWDSWDRRSAPAPAPLPVYQRQYSGDRYPQQEQQRQIQSQSYRYQPRDALVRQHNQEQAGQRSPPPSQRGQPQQGVDPRESQSPRSGPDNVPQGRGVTQEPRRGVEDNQRSAPTQAPTQAPPQPRSPAVQEQRQQPPQPQQAPQGAGSREQQPSRASPDNVVPQGRGAMQEPRRGPPQQESDREKDRDKADERGQQRNR